MTEDKKLILLNQDRTEAAFYCPACECSHAVWMGYPGRPSWMWNGSVDKPTFSPSVRVQHGDGIMCHFHLVEGRFHYCGDSNHGMAGSVVDMEPL